MERTLKQNEMEVVTGVRAKLMCCSVPRFPGPVASNSIATAAKIEKG